MITILGMIFLYIIIGGFLFYKKIFVKATEDFSEKHKDITFGNKKFIRRIELSLCYENVKNKKVCRVSFDLNKVISIIIFWPFALFGL